MSVKRFLFLSSLAVAVLAAGLYSNTAVAKSKKKKGEDTFQKSASGMEYKMLYDKEGPIAKEGDYVEIHINTRYNDSLVFDSRVNNGAKPVTFPLSKPRFNGDLAEAIMMMSAGDSMVATVMSDSLKVAGQKMQPWMKPSGKIVYIITLLSIKTQNQMNQERDAATSVQLEKDDKILQKYFADNNLKPLKTASGLYYTILKEGKGVNPREGQKVFVSYTGKTMDGTVFDSNLDPKFNHVEPLSFPLGMQHVIRGWDEGVALLNTGAKATFYIPSTLAYGTNSPMPAIPANSILIFDVELLEIR